MISLVLVLQHSIENRSVRSGRMLEEKQFNGTLSVKAIRSDLDHCLTSGVLILTSVGFSHIQIFFITQLFRVNFHLHYLITVTRFTHEPPPRM